MGFGFAAGPSLSLTRHDVHGWDIELKYFGIDGWHAGADFPTGGNLVIEQGGTTLPVSSATFDEHSRLYNGELNFRHPFGPWLTPLIGFRWVQLNDDYQAAGNTPPATPHPPSFLHTINAFNHMYGLQIGTDAFLYQHGGVFRIDGFVRSGIFCNAASQNSSLSYQWPAFGVDDEWSAAGSVNHTAFVGELGLNASYQINRHVVLHGGYRVMLVDGWRWPRGRFRSPIYSAARRGSRPPARLCITAQPRPRHPLVTAAPRGWNRSCPRSSRVGIVPIEHRPMDTTRL